VRRRKDFDLVFCEFEWNALIGAAISFMVGKPCIWDTHAVDPKISNMRNLLKKLVARFSKIIIAVSDLDRERLTSQGFPRNKIVVIPTSAELQLADKVNDDSDHLRRRLGLDTGKRILIFVGHINYQPNREAANWIDKELAPALSARFNNVQILITGAGEKPATPHEKVTYTGFVPNIFEYILASDICLAPIWSGVGMLTKVIDFMSCAKPVVVASFAVKGIPELRDKSNAVIAHNPREFIQETISLIEHPEEARKIGLAARKTIEKYYNGDSWESRLNEVITGCVNRK
jgi:glycosyltransferase involved in cell wall biosynthesis